MSLPRCGSVVAALSALLLFGCSSRQGEQLDETKLASLRQKVGQLEKAAVLAEAERLVSEQEQGILKNATAPPDPKPGPVDNITRNTVYEALKVTAEARLAYLNLQVTPAKVKCDESLQSLVAAHEQAAKAQDELGKYKTQLVREGNAADLNDTWDRVLIFLVAWGVLLVAAGFWLAGHVERVWLRQLRRSGIGFALVLLATFAATARADEQAYLQGQEKKLTSEVEERKASQEKCLKDVQSQRGKILAFWKGLLGENHGEAFVGKENEAYEALHQWLVSLKAAELADARARELLDKAKRDQDERKQLGDNVGTLNATRLGMKLLACVAFPLVALLPLYFASRRVAVRLAKAAKQCPRCLAEKYLPNPKKPEEVKDALVEMKLKLKDPRYPESRFLECQDCKYRFRASYAQFPRLSIPTVGSKFSGKTHWLVTTYDLVKNSRVPVAGQIDNVTSPNEAEEFDKQVEVILQKCIDPDPTIEHSLPSPLTFHIGDGSQFGACRVLLNLFDFSGEVMNRRIDVDAMRCRALLMDGFVLFLDPTQVARKGGTGIDLDTQIRQLAAFRDEMRAIRQLGPGARLRVPIAVCVPKIDLLVSQSVMGEPARRWIAKLRETAKAPLSLQTIEQRSAMLAEILPRLFPGWDVKKMLRESFGDCFRFFPMTPVNIEDRELGMTDLNRRTPAPFGVLEPVAWLLYMRGYNVLS